jgi:hypothetical protein
VKTEIPDAEGVTAVELYGFVNSAELGFGRGKGRGIDMNRQLITPGKHPHTPNVIRMFVRYDNRIQVSWIKLS